MLTSLIEKLNTEVELIKNFGIRNYLLITKKEKTQYGYLDCRGRLVVFEKKLYFKFLNKLNEIIVFQRL